MVRPPDEESPAVWKPPDTVDDALVPVRLRNPAATPPLKVEVEFTPVTLRKPAIDEVALVVVAIK
jgi:hypothetical protein